MCMVDPGSWLQRGARAWLLAGTIGCAACAAPAATPARAPLRAASPGEQCLARPEATSETVVPDAAKVALGIGAVGLATGLLSIPTSEPADGAPSSFALAAMGTGAAGLVIGGVIVLVTPRRAPVRARVNVAPTGVVAAGSF